VPQCSSQADCKAHVSDGKTGNLRKVCNMYTNIYLQAFIPRLTNTFFTITLHQIGSRILTFQAKKHIERAEMIYMYERNKIDITSRFFFILYFYYLLICINIQLNVYFFVFQISMQL